MTGGAYVLGIVEVLAFVAAVGFSGYRLRGWLLPAWSGSVARLAEAVLALSIVVCLSELLGIVGLFRDVPLLAGAAVLALGCSRLPPYSALTGVDDVPDRPASYPMPFVAIAIALAITAFVVAAWIPDATQTLDRGIWGFDSMWFHLPEAARFAQTGSLTGLVFDSPLDVPHWFFPHNSELVHAVGMVLLDRDVLSPLMNLGWLALALFAAWCVGRPYGAGALSMLAVSPILISHPLISLQAGMADNDIPTIALLLCATALLLNGAYTAGSRADVRFPGSLAAISVAGLAAGLAVGTRLNPIPFVVVIGLGLVALARPGGRSPTALAWFGSVLATSAFWYLRNLFAAGNPLPFTGIHLGPLSLPATEQVIHQFPKTSIADLIGNGAVWHTYFLPGLKSNYGGDLWFVVLGLALAGMIGSSIARESPVRGVVGAAALVGLIAYLFTPYSATGPGGAPTQFGLNLRVGTPAIALGLVLLPTLPALRSRAARSAVAAVSLATLIVAFETHTSVYRDAGHHGAVILGASAFTIAAIVALVVAKRLSRLELAFYASVVVVVAAAAFWPVARDYVRNRYAVAGLPWPDVGTSFRWANGVSDARIGVSGTTACYFQYGYSGSDVSNTVQCIGQPGPRGSFTPIQTCAQWREEVNRGRYDYLVTSPTYNRGDVTTPGYSPERDWLDSDPAASRVLREGPVVVFRLDGPLDPTGCSQIKPLFSGLPPLLNQ